jgi:hypothetical protein
VPTPEQRENEPLSSTISCAERLLGARWGQPVRLQIVEQFESAHRVLRCRVVAPSDGVPGSVVVKQLGQTDDSLLFPPRQQFLNEWASLEFISDLKLACGPQLYGGDDAAQMIVVEDLGEGPSLQDLLFGHDRAAATQALAEWSGLLGRMQEVSAPCQEAFLALQSSRGASTALSDGSADVRDFLPVLHECLQVLAVAPHSDFDEAVHAVGAAMRERSPLWTLVHFDAGPHNVQPAEHGLRMLDFEFAGLGNGLIDIVGARMAFPAAYRGRRVPAGVVEAFEERYRAERNRTIALFREEASFHAALAQACAHWALTKLWGFWKNYLRTRLAKGPSYDAREGRDPARAAYFRQMVFTYLSSFAGATQAWRVLPELRVTIEQVMEALCGYWPELEPWPLYPAFS